MSDREFRAGPTTQALGRAGATSLVVRRARLVVEHGPDAGREAPLDQGSLRVGTSTENDLVLTDPAVSARHFELRATEHGHLLRDLGSTNGTFVHDCRVGQLTLSRTTQIVVGESRLRLIVLRDDLRLPLSPRTRFGDLLGDSGPMRASFVKLERAATTDATVLITGESGTGKELAARAVHQGSRRGDGPFVVFDCGATTPGLVEDQLFGHGRGAYTGAVDARGGVLEAAHRGTLVLDEIGELPLEVQPKLLRVLETRTFSRIGETKPRTVDVRFVACTNRNLEEEVRCGRFRRDLFFRLSVIAVSLPPLRERKGDIPRLLRHFVAHFAGGRAEQPEVPQELVEVLQSHDWPGNVRELRNVVERYLALADATPSALLLTTDGASAPAVPPIPTHLPFLEAKARWTEIFERAYVTALLEEHHGNVSAVARAAGLSRQSCYRLLQKHGIDAG